MQILYNFSYERRKIIADNIRIYKAKQHISQETLAELSGTNQQYIAKIENEKANIRVYKLMNIAEALKVNILNLTSE